MTCKFMKRTVFIFPVYIFCFLFVYSVGIPDGPNFSHLGLLFLPVFLSLIPSVAYNMRIVLKSVLFWWVFLCFFSFMIVSAFFSFVHGSGEMSLLFTIAHSILSIFACLAISAFIVSCYPKSPLTGMLSFLGFLLKLQIFFILLMLISPEVRDVVFSLIRTESQQTRMSGYGGSRGLGISGSIAYGLATFLSTLYVTYFYLKYVIKGPGFAVLDYLWIVLGGIALLSAGRTAILGIVGLPLAVALYSIKIGNLSVSGFLSRIFFIFILCSLAFFLMDTLGIFEIPAIQSYWLYVFEPIQLYLDSGSFSVSSVDTLNDMYYYPGDLTFIFGDGKYIGDYGGYYQSVDAGYMRYVLYGGFIYLFYSVLSVMFLYYLFYRVMSDQLHGSLVLVLCLFLMSLVFHYKGAFLMIAVSNNKLYFIVMFLLILTARRRRFSI